MAAPLHCAIYTRKSSEEGLEQSYNSLDAQRDACAAFVLSQAGEGWSLLPTTYDDGGYSGGTLERPGLQRLLADIRARRIDVVVVCKVDRLTRSLAGFARIVEVLDQHGASFVSVTQAFNTTTSMGRLTLNVLLSFAQFEREVTGERIRGKIAASKRLGMWMGGIVPLGYRPAGRTLAVEPAEAETVRRIYQRYLDLGSVHRLRDELIAAGIRSKKRIDRTGREVGGKPFDRGALSHLLRNPLYVGNIRHKGVTYPGEHAAIVERDLFDAAQRKLDGQAASTTEPSNNSRTRRTTISAKAPLTGRLFDSSGNRMSPVSARKKGGAVYRYYVSQHLQTGRRGSTGNGRRVNAVSLEQQILHCMVQLGLVPEGAETPDWGCTVRHILRVEVSNDRLALTLVSTDALLPNIANPSALRVRLGESAEMTTADGGITLSLPLELSRRSGRIVAFHAAGDAPVQPPELDATLGTALIRAEAWKRRLLDGRISSIEAIAQAERVTPGYIARMVRIAFLAPKLKRQILEGRQPARLSLQRLMTGTIPLAWHQQTALYQR